MQTGTEKILLVVAISTFLLVLLAGFIIIVFLQYEKRQILYFKNIEQMKLEHENDLLTAQLEMQESTLMSISQEIHDNIGLSLTLAKLNLSSVEIADRKTSQILVDDSGNLITKAIRDLSDLSRSFNTEIILNQGFAKSIEIELRRLSRGLGFKTNLHSNGEPFFLPSKVEVILFRIFQESLNNILKHAQADRIDVALLFSAEQFIFHVTDNGQGFDFDEEFLKKVNRAGLKNIMHRALIIGAVGEIDSKKGQGTRITVTLPINKLS